VLEEEDAARVRKSPGAEILDEREIPREKRSRKAEVGRRKTEGGRRKSGKENGGTWNLEPGKRERRNAGAPGQARNREEAEDEDEDEDDGCRPPLTPTTYYLLFGAAYPEYPRCPDCPGLQPEVAFTGYPLGGP
jgi:hypothetical protein